MPMPERRHVLLALVVLAAQILGCASNDVGVSAAFDPLTPFPRQATYSWNEAANSLPDEPGLRGLDLDRLIKQTADAEFGLRGYRAVAGSANYRLHYDLTVNTWIGLDNSRSMASLSLTLVESETDHRVWMGFVRTDVRVGLSEAERVERMHGALAKLLAEFPPAQRGE